MRGLFTFIFFLVLLNNALSQSTYWQQRVNYDMNIIMDVDKHQYNGEQQLIYTNNSPDTLYHVFYHLYFNAFQPGSMMDIRSRTIMDPDDRISDRIQFLSDEEIGFIKIESLLCDGKALSFEENGTILEVKLTKPIIPGQSVALNMVFKAQIPIQIRRSGVNNKEGIDYSMSQWYPKICEYDEQGWHSNPYIGREFYGVWGDYNVFITMPSKYMIGASGVLINASEIGHGYVDYEVPHHSDLLTWHFKADNVHDFAFAADPDYTHMVKETANGTKFHFLYVNSVETTEWPLLPDVIVKSFSFINKRFGTYPYPVYSIIQAGDGGMEYPMATFISGHRKIRSLIGVSLHEIMHSWYQMMLGTNEALYAWMDEGFTSYAETEVIEFLKENELIEDKKVAFPWKGTYNTYLNFINSNYAEPASTHSDHFNTNYAYGLNAYFTGNIFLKQLEYIIGKKAMSRVFLKYFNAWKFKHPKPNDFMRIVEKDCHLELDWYKEYWIHTTKTIDYKIDTLISDGEQTIISLQKLGKMPMPLDIVVSLKDGNTISYNIPLRIMRGHKVLENGMILLEDWPWTNPFYKFTIDEKLINIKSISIDPSLRMADISRADNTWIAP